MFSGAIACCNGDTWASEFGSVLSFGDPVLITNLQSVPRGNLVNNSSLVEHMCLLLFHLIFLNFFFIESLLLFTCFLFSALNTQAFQKFVVPC